VFIWIQMVNNKQNQSLSDNEMDALKGLSRLRFKSAEDSLDEARNSVHRWWWEFLRLSKDYWLICQTSTSYRVETQDEALAFIYRHWGDIHKCSFEEWWLKTGHAVFMEKEAFPKVKELPRKPRERHLTKLLHDHLLIDIPLKLSRRTIQSQIGKILHAHQNQRLRNRLELSSSEFKINPVQFRLNTLQKMHEVFVLHREMIVKPSLIYKVGVAQANNEAKADLFRIGKLLRISPSNESLRGESSEIIKKQNRMRASVSRLLRRTELLIANCEIGIFPSFKSVPLNEKLPFTDRQMKRHLDLERDWWQLDLTSKLSAVKIDNAKQIHYEEVERTRNAISNKSQDRVVLIRDA